MDPRSLTVDAIVHEQLGKKRTLGGKEQGGRRLRKYRDSRIHDGGKIRNLTYSRYRRQVDEAGRQERLTCHRGSKTPRRVGRLTTINILEQRNDNEHGLPFVRSPQLGGLSNILEPQ